MGKPKGEKLKSVNLAILRVRSQTVSKRLYSTSLRERYPDSNWWDVYRHRRGSIEVLSRGAAFVRFSDFKTACR